MNAIRTQLEKRWNHWLTRRVSFVERIWSFAMSMIHNLQMPHKIILIITGLLLQLVPMIPPKKLICGHIFHFHCLRSWLERQQTCPTCRRPVIQAPPATHVAPQNPNAAVNRAFAAAMAAAGGAVPPAIPPAVPAAARGGPPAAPMAIPAAQPTHPPQPADGSLMGTRPDGTRQDFHQRMREFEQRYAAAAAANAAASNPAAPGGPIRQAQSRPNPLLQFDLSSHPTPSSSRPIPGPVPFRHRLSPGSRPISIPYPTLSTPRPSVDNHSQTSAEQRQASSTPHDLANSLVKATSTSSASPEAHQTDVRKDQLEADLTISPEDPSKVAEAQTVSQSSTIPTEQSSDKEPQSPGSQKPESGLAQPTTPADLRANLGGLDGQMPQLPCLIPLFDHPDVRPTLTQQALLEHYQRRIGEAGSRGQPLPNDGALDPKVAQLLDIQNCLVDCCAKLARYMAPIPSDLHPAPPGHTASQCPVPHAGSSSTESHSPPASSPTALQDNSLPVDQLGKGKGKSQPL